MKINDLSSAHLNGLSTGSVASSAGVAAYGRSGRGGYGTASDQVQLSGASRIASSAMAQHVARLGQLKAQIASGEYNPSGEAVGKAMLADVLSRT